MRRLVALVTLTIFFGPSALAAGPGEAPGLSRVMQGNNAYGIRDFTSKFPPTTMLGYFKANLPTVVDARGNKMKDPDSLGVAFTSETPMPSLSSIRVFTSAASEVNSVASYLCKGVSDPTCAPNHPITVSMQIDSVMGICANSPGTSCIEKITVTTEDGKTSAITPVKQLPGVAPTFPAGREEGGLIYPAGGATWLWSDGQSGLYFVRGVIVTKAEKKSSKWISQAPTLEFEITPVITEDAPVIAPRLETFALNGTDTPVVRTVGIFPDCVITDTGICYHRTTFSNGVRLSATLQVPSNLSGWLNGRLLKPDVTSKPLSSTVDQLVITAGATKNIVAGSFVKTSLIPPALLTNADGSLNFFGVNKDQGGAVMSSGDVNALEDYKKWQSALGEKALIINEAWTVASTLTPATDTCRVQGIQGVVTSNASAYSPGAPEWNAALQTIDYRVAAPHFAPDGSTLNLGTYGLSMKADLMKCLYKITRIPSFASISITSESSGEKNIESVAIGQNGDWVHLSADGFTFSSPTLRVKLAQAEPTQSATPPVTSTVPAPSTPVAVTVAPAKTTITCVKGKTTKKVTGVKPLCPTGYKKK